MKRSTELHLESVSEASLMEWKRNDAFIVFASHVGGGMKSVQLGANGNGHYEIRFWEQGEMFKEIFGSALSAIIRYTELLSI